MTNTTQPAAPALSHIMLDRQVWYGSDGVGLSYRDDEVLVRMIAEALFVGASDWAVFIAGYIRDEATRSRALSLSASMEAA